MEKFKNEKRIIEFHSRKKASETVFPKCGGRVCRHGIRKVRLTDVPYASGYSTVYEIHQHRYRCKECGATFCENNPFKAPGMNLTKRCVTWIFRMMKYKIPTAYIADLFGIHWNTVRKLEKMRIDFLLEMRENERLNSICSISHQYRQA